MSAEENRHASCVAVGERALLILGAPGSGKSALALDLMALGATLVSDDRTVLRRAGDAVTASPHPRLAGLIEARGVGVLRAPYRDAATVALALDLDEEEPDRLPQGRRLRLLGASIPLLFRPSELRASAIMARLRHGAPANPDAAMRESGDGPDRSA